MSYDGYLIQKAFRMMKEGTIEQLIKLEEELIKANFNAPLKPMAKIKQEIERSEEDIKDIKKHLAYFRHLAFLKKSILRQLKIAIAARKLQSTIKSDLKYYVPIDGNYILRLIEAGEYSVVVYKRINDLFDKYAKEEVRYVGEEKVKKKIVRNRIIRSKAMRVAISTAIATYSFDSVKIEESERLKEYNNIIKQYGIIENSFVEFIDGFEELKEELKDKGFLKANGETDEGIAKEILTIKRKQFKEAEKRAVLLFLSPLIKFYLTKTRAEREKEPLYPGLKVVPDEYNLAMFEEIGQYDKELKGISKAIKEKLEVEEFDSSVENSCKLITKYTDKDIEWACKYLGGDKTKVMSEKDEERAKKFIEELKMQKNKDN